jgi:hypothetical protein
MIETGVHAAPEGVVGQVGRVGPGRGGDPPTAEWCGRCGVQGAGGAGCRVRAVRGAGCGRCGVQGAGGAGCGNCKWLTWRHRCRMARPWLVAVARLRLAATGAGRGAVLAVAGRRGGWWWARRNDSSGRCPMHLGSLALLWGHSIYVISDISFGICRTSDPKVGRVTPKRTTPIAARPWPARARRSAWRSLRAG